MSGPARLTDGRSVGLLVSVRDTAEAEVARSCGADLIDAKDPARGALGALPVEVVAAIAEAARAGEDPPLVSAVAGEPGSIAELAGMLAAMTGAGVDFLKVAIPADAQDRSRELRGAVADFPIPVIAVLFAEDRPEDFLVSALAEAGFAGAMIDTRLKDGRRLPDYLSPELLASFTASCRGAGLISGLAGSLAISDIPALAAPRPSYLGFRGGLCSGSERSQALDPGRIREAVRQLAASERREAA